MSDENTAPENQEAAQEAAPAKTPRKTRKAAPTVEPEVAPEAPVYELPSVEGFGADMTSEETPELGELNTFGSSSFYIRK